MLLSPVGRSVRKTRLLRIFEKIEFQTIGFSIRMENALQPTVRREPTPCSVSLPLGLPAPKTEQDIRRKHSLKHGLYELTGSGLFWVTDDSQSRAEICSDYSNFDPREPNRIRLNLINPNHHCLCHVRLGTCKNGHTFCA